jgi:high mobility group protein B1
LAADKTRWESLSRDDDDKVRYEAEKAAVMGPWNVPVGTRSSLKDPSAPKRPMSAYLAYSNKRRGAVKRQNPQLSNAELSKTLSIMWKGAPQAVRQKYIQAEFAKRKAYKIAIAEWKSSHSKGKRVQHHKRDKRTFQIDEVKRARVSTVQGVELGAFQADAHLLEGNGTDSRSMAGLYQQDERISSARDHFNDRLRSTYLEMMSSSRQSEYPTPPTHFPTCQKSYDRYTHACCFFLALSCTDPSTNKLFPTPSLYKLGLAGLRNDAALALIANARLYTDHFILQQQQPHIHSGWNAPYWQMMMTPTTMMSASHVHHWQPLLYG